MFNKAACLFILVWQVVALSGCTTVQSTKEPSQSRHENDDSQVADKAKSVYLGTLEKTSRVHSQLLDGIWVVEMNCKVGRDTHRQHGLLEMVKDGRHKFNANFYIFENQNGSWTQNVSYKNGTLLEMEGAIEINGDIYLEGRGWRLKSNRSEPIDLEGALYRNNFIFSGRVLKDKNCSEFIASKAPVNNTIENDPVFLFENKSNFFQKLSKPNSFYFDPKECLKYFKWVSKGSSKKIIENKNRPSFLLNSIYLNDEEMIKYFGKTYHNWSHEDAEAYHKFTFACERTVDQWMPRKERKRISNYSKVKPYFLEVGKNTPNHPSALEGGGKRGLFAKLGKEPPNIVWAGNYFKISAAKSALEYKSAIVKYLNKLDASDASLVKINEHIEFSDFPFNFLPEEQQSSYVRVVQVIKENIENQMTEKMLDQIDLSQYPKTLDGYKSLLRDTEYIVNQINALTDKTSSSALNKRYGKLLSEHSNQAAQDIFSQAPQVPLTTEGYKQLLQYVRDAGDGDVDILLKEHRDQAIKGLDNRIEIFLGEFYENIEPWISQNIPLGEEGVHRLNETALALFHTGIKNRPAMNKLSGHRKNIADRLLKEVDNLQDTCDQLAAHPMDYRLPPYIIGVSDSDMNVDLAIDACITSMESNAHNPRTAFQLGRALFIGGLYGDAEYYLDQAAAQDYSPANYYLGEFYTSGLGGGDKDVDKAIEYYNIAANDGFIPAIKVVKKYNENLAYIKAEETKVTFAPFKLKSVMIPFMDGRLDDVRHGIGMKYIHDLTKLLYETCESGVTSKELNAMREKFSIHNAPGYVDYIKSNNLAMGRGVFGLGVPVPAKWGGPSYDEDSFDLHVLEDMVVFLQKYGCFGDSYDRFMAYAKQFILGPDVPPFNILNEDYWNICLRDARPAKVESKRFCSCFLNKIRHFDLPRKSAKYLQTIFWKTAQDIISHPDNEKLRLDVCTRPRSQNIWGR